MATVVHLFPVTFLMQWYWVLLWVVSQSNQLQLWRNQERWVLGQQIWPAVQWPLALCNTSTHISHTHITPHTHSPHAHITGIREVERVSENQIIPPQVQDTHQPGLSLQSRRCTAPQDTSSPPMNSTQMTATGSSWSVTFVTGASSLC